MDGEIKPLARSAEVKGRVMVTGISGRARNLKTVLALSLATGASIALLTLGAGLAHAKRHAQRLAPIVHVAVTADRTYFVRQSVRYREIPTDKRGAALYVIGDGGRAVRVGVFPGWAVMNLEVAGDSPILALQRSSGRSKNVIMKSRVVAVDPSNYSVRSIQRASLKARGRDGYCGSWVDISGRPLGERFVVRERWSRCKKTGPAGSLRGQPRPAMMDRFCRWTARPYGNLGGSTCTRAGFSDRSGYRTAATSML